MKTKNYYSKENVNVAQGPRTGNESAHKGKRAAFKEAKEAREPEARYIEDAFANRQLSIYEDHDFPKEGAIEPSIKAKFANSKKK